VLRSGDRRVKAASPPRVVWDEFVRTPLRWLRRRGSATFGLGRHRRPLDWNRDRTVLLFFEDFERDTLFSGDRRIKRALRKVVHATRRGQRVSGLGVAFDRLVVALRRAGCDVVVNDGALARRNPQYPVGLAGYPGVIDYWDLPNPQMIGHGPYDHPSVDPELMDDPRRRIYLAASSWVADMFETGYPGKNEVWFAGVDLEEWPDYSGHEKTIDFVIYDKIRWNETEVRAAIRNPVEAALRARGLRYEVLVYRGHDQATYRSMLEKARGLIFLCEHENQGLAYQEAMATGCPVFAWDPGSWHDPNRFGYGVDHVAASSVPYFADGVTGERFHDSADLCRRLDDFVARWDSYAPRAWVEEHLSLAASAARYLELYTSLLPPAKALAPESIDRH
jgi:glycosyltransferase involved in cell wall biosynthesis